MEDHKLFLTLCVQSCQTKSLGTLVLVNINQSYFIPVCEIFCFFDVVGSGIRSFKELFGSSNFWIIDCLFSNKILVTCKPSPAAYLFGICPWFDYESFHSVFIILWGSTKHDEIELVSNFCILICPSSDDKNISWESKIDFDWSGCCMDI